MNFSARMPHYWDIPDGMRACLGDTNPATMKETEQCQFRDLKTCKLEETVYPHRSGHMDYSKKVDLNEVVKEQVKRKLCAFAASTSNAMVPRCSMRGYLWKRERVVSRNLCWAGRA